MEGKSILAQMQEKKKAERLALEQGVADIMKRKETNAILKQSPAVLAALVEFHEAKQETVRVKEIGDWIETRDGKYSNTEKLYPPIKMVCDHFGLRRTGSSSGVTYRTPHELPIIDAETSVLVKRAVYLPDPVPAESLDDMEIVEE